MLIYRFKKIKIKNKGINKNEIHRFLDKKMNYFINFIIYLIDKLVI